MSVSTEDALKKMTALPGVKGAFVFNQYQAVVAREIPGNYSSEVLKRIATQLYQLVALSYTNGVSAHEFRLVYDQYAIFFRLFSPQQQLYLVIFTDKKLDVAELRQQLNLAVLVLEKAFRRTIDKPEKPEVAQIAILAEQSLRSAIDEDQTFVGNARKLCFRFLGFYGAELVDAALEEEYLTVPIKSESEMRKLSSYVLTRLIHPLKREILQEGFADLIRASLRS